MNNFKRGWAGVTLENKAQLGAILGGIAFVILRSYSELGAVILSLIIAGVITGSHWFVK